MRAQLAFSLLLFFALIANSQQSHIPIENSISCSICKTVVNIAYDIVTSHSSVVALEDMLGNACVSLNLTTAAVCRGLMAEFAPTVFYILTHIETPDRICHQLRFCHDKNLAENLPNNPRVAHLDEPIAPYVEPMTINVGGKPRKMVQLTDIHLDPFYEPGSNANCMTPLCCRSWEGKGDAGHFGDMKCDMSENLFWNLLVHIRDEVKPDYVLFTGDSVPHDVWNQTFEYNMDVSRVVAETMRRAFRHTDIKVIPCMGNHEPFPIDQCPPPTGEVNSTELYRSLTDFWSDWLTVDAELAMEHAGYFSLTPEPGLRVISLNMQSADLMNLWNLLKIDDGGQMDWLEKQLGEAQRLGEDVWILGHIPMGGRWCNDDYSIKFHKLLERYHDVIQGIFSGHEHTSHVRVFRDWPKRTTPIAVTYISPSVTPYQDQHPGFRVFEFGNGKKTHSFELTDCITYNTHLPEINLHPERKPVWNRVYSVKEAFGMKDLSPAEWWRVLQRMQTDDALFRKFYSYVRTGAPPGECNADCKKQQLCHMTTETYETYSECVFHV